ncbi:MAG: hypothetical protein FWG71_01980 [Synergistaceae bacterium]|nr:hypothetical protein [Synergistaceae bacterium]
MLRLENTGFFRALGEGVEKIPSHYSRRVKCSLSLVAFKSIAITPFSFPFNNVLRVREALKLQSLPYAAAGEMEFFPFLLEKTSRSGSGVVFYLPSGELENYPVPQPQTENRVWPAPLPLVSQIGGEGVTFWMDEENICSMLWRGGAPVLYRWKPRAGATSDTELAWYELYCKSKGGETGEVFVMDATVQSELARLPDIVKESLALCPWIGDVNMSRGALDSAVVLERIVQSLSKAVSWILIMGLFVLAGNGLRYYEARRNVNALRGRTVELYRSVFEPSRTGPVSDPLGLARSTVHQLKGGSSDGHSMSEMFSNLGDIFEQNPDMNVTLDVTRYNPDGVDYTGSAPDMETAQEFRRAWSERAGSAQLGNLNTVPGGSGYRFDLYVRW